MLVRVMQAIHLGGKDYRKGIHEIPSEVLKHASAQHAIKAGYIQDASEQGLIRPESLQDRQLRLAEKLHKSVPGVAAPQAKIQKPEIKDAAPVLAVEDVKDSSVNDEPEQAFADDAEDDSWLSSEADEKKEEKMPKKKAKDKSKKKSAKK